MQIAWSEVVSNLSLIATAYLLAIPIGWDRERSERSAGLRTFPLVAVGACGYMLIALSTLDSGESHARAMYGIISGIGFIGGGAILKGNARVSGTATAASIWNTGAMGVAVAWHRIEIALVLSMVNFITLRYVSLAKADTNAASGGD